MVPSSPAITFDTELPAPEQIRLCLEHILHVHEDLRDLQLEIALAECGFKDTMTEFGSGTGLDRVSMARLTALALRPQSTMADVVRLVRGETLLDPRPNKALRPSDYRWLLHGYEHAEFMVSSASHGLQPTWLRPSPDQDVRPKNHQSADRFKNSVARSIRAGQDAGQYLVVDASVLDRWPAVQISPLGAVEKAGVDPNDEVRLIHDLKRPLGDSTNEATDRSELPSLTYVPVSRLARRIEWLYAKNPQFRIRMMKGDVKGAFRHLMIHFNSVGWMGALLAHVRALVIDLSAPFGWTSSPTYYGAYGGAITWLVRRESPASLAPGDGDSECFYAYEWVDDHVLIEHDTPNRLRLAASALRLSMMAVFGPRALNEKKFSNWESRLEVLGLEFDLDKRTVSMPRRKILKACDRIASLIPRQRASRSELLKLLGSLRHVCTCCRAVKPFFQRIQTLSNVAPSFGSVSITDGVRQDLKWSLALLQAGRFQELPTSMFNAWPDPDIHLYMDASHEGLAVLDPATRRFIQLRFDKDEKDLIAQPSATNGFTINVREQLSIALAVRIWGPSWHDRFSTSVGHVWCWVDNTTAVSVTNKLSSRNTLAQELNRHIGFAEAVHGFRVRCLHLPGTLNTMADAASRAWAAPHTDVWRLLSQGWTQDAITPTLRKLYVPNSTSFSKEAWQPAPHHEWSPWLPREQPDHSEQLALFATYCWSKPPLGLGNAATTVLSKISAVSWRHRLQCGFPVGLHAGHLLAVQGMRRVSAPPVAKAPATIPILRACRARCNFATAHDRVLWGTTLVGYFYMLRSSEYLQVNGVVAPTAITSADITCRTRQGEITTCAHQTVRVDVRLRGSKTDQEGRCVVLSHERSGSGWLCPVLAILDLLSFARESGFDPAAPLCTVDGSRSVKAAAVITKLRAAAQACGTEPSRMGTHSLRIGGATAMFAAGVDKQTIKIFGRWASDSVDRYTRLSSKVSSTLAARMSARPPPSLQQTTDHTSGERPPRPPQSEEAQPWFPGINTDTLCPISRRC